MQRTFQGMHFHDQFVDFLKVRYLEDGDDGCQQPAAVAFKRHREDIEEGVAKMSFDTLTVGLSVIIVLLFALIDFMGIEPPNNEDPL